MNARARIAFRAAQVIFLVAAFALVGIALVRQWDTLGPALRGGRADVGGIGLATLLVAASYVVLIYTWRQTLQQLGEQLRIADAARIWFISNLGRYLPGKIWQIAAMAAMATDAGVSPIAATLASLVVNAASVAAGFAIVGLAAPDLLAARAGLSPAFAVTLTVTGIAILVAAPFLLTPAIRALGKGRKLSGVAALSPRMIALALGGTALAWVTYGVAFWFFARAVSDWPAGATLGALAVYTLSYLAGYLALIAPGGVVVREVVLVQTMVSLGLVETPAAWRIALLSRLWLTVVEVLPGFVLLLHHAVRHFLPRTPPDGA